MSELVFESNSEADTFQLGQKLGKNIDSPLVCFLHGTLGAGKTRLVQAVADGLDIDSTNVNSPTFTIMVPHSGRLQLVHVDAYRINHVEELDELGLDDFIADGCVMMIEWAERISSVFQKPDLTIQIEHVDEERRSIRLQAFSEPAKTLLQSLQ